MIKKLRKFICVDSLNGYFYADFKAFQGFLEGAKQSLGGYGQKSVMRQLNLDLKHLKC